MNDLHGAAFAFGPFRLEAEQGIVTRDGETVVLTPKEFNTLVVLVEAGGRVVRKEELIERIWPDSFVGDGSLARNISVLRKALGESLIETIPRRGYRLTLPVELAGSKTETSNVGNATGTATVSVPFVIPSPTEVVPGVQPESKRQARDWRHSPVRWAIFASLLVLGGILSLLVRGTSSTSVVRGNAVPARIAVLPFANYTGVDQQSYLCDGLTEAMISELSRLSPSELGVIARTSVMKYKQTTKTIPEIARDLKVDYVLESSVRSAGDRLLVTTQLVRGDDASNLWTGEYERELRNVLDVQQQVSIAIASEIRIHLSSATQVRLQRSHGVDPEAFRDYLLGRYYWNKRNKEGLFKSVEFFNRAISRDPRYARAYSGLADAYLVLGGGYIPDVEAYAKARTAALKAVELDNSLAEAYASLAYEKFVNERDWAGADQDYQKAIALDPGYATARQWYALYLLAMSRPEEAIQQVDRALELDPLSLPVAYNAGRIYFEAGRHAAGLALTRRALDIDPNNAPTHGSLAAEYLSTGVYDQAIAEFRAAQKLRGGYSPYAIEVAHVYAVEGWRTAARDTLEPLLSDPKWGEVAPYSFAVTFAALGQKDKAFRWLRKSVEDHSCTVNEISTDQALDPLRGDARFAEIRRQFRLPG